MKTILAAIDFSPVTKRVVAEAVALARAAQARVILLNVTSPESLVQDYAALEAVVGGSDPQDGKAEGAGNASHIHGDALQVVGEPIDAILEQAARCSADYVVMGSHGHTALFELIVGSTTAGVVRRSQCPVMIVPSAQGRQRRKPTSLAGRKRALAWRLRTRRRKGGSRMKTLR